MTATNTPKLRWSRIPRQGDIRSHWIGRHGVTGKELFAIWQEPPEGASKQGGWNKENRLFRLDGNEHLGTFQNIAAAKAHAASLITCDTNMVNREKNR